MTFENKECLRELCVQRRGVQRLGSSPAVSPRAVLCTQNADTAELHRVYDNTYAAACTEVH